MARFMIVFLASVIALRLAGRLVSTSLGLSDSLVNSVGGAFVSLVTAALFLGTGVVVIQASATAEVREEKPGAVLTDKAFGMARRMDAPLQSTVLGPRLGSFAALFLAAALELRH